MSRLTQNAFVAASLLMLGSAGAAHAQFTALTFNSLPSAQGWTYIGTGNTSESSIFSVVNDALQQRTVGKGAIQAYYELDGLADFSKPFSMEMRASILNQDNGNAYGLCMGAYDTTKYVILSLSSIAPDNLVHDYVLTGDFTTDTFQLTIDGVVGIPVSDVMSPTLNGIFFGDGTPTGSNANVDITSFTFNQNAAATPEPGSLALLGGGIGLGLFSRRRLRKARVQR